MTDHEPTDYFTRNVALEAKRPDRRTPIIEDKPLTKDMGGGGRYGRKKVFRILSTQNPGVHRPTAIKNLMPRIITWLEAHVGWHSVSGIQRAPDLGMHLGTSYTKEITAALLADPSIRNRTLSGAKQIRQFQHRCHGDDQ